MNKNIIAVTIGDINGIGIEILIKLWKSKKIIRQSSQLNKIDRIKIKFYDRKVDVKIEKA